MQQASAKDTSTKPLDTKGLERVDQLLSEIDSSGEFFKLASGQQATITFDIDSQLTGMRNRTFKTNEGEKEIARFNFAIWNPQIKKNQLFELSNRWTRRALEAMKDYKTTTLTVKRKGTGLSDTEYLFLPAGLNQTTS